MDLSTTLFQWGKPYAKRGLLCVCSTFWLMLPSHPNHLHRCNIIADFQLVSDFCACIRYPRIACRFVPVNSLRLNYLFSVTSLGWIQDFSKDVWLDYYIFQQICNKLYAFLLGLQGWICEKHVHTPGSATCTGYGGQLVQIDIGLVSVPGQS